MALSSIPLPSSTNINIRIAWAGDIFQDLIYGTYNTNEGWYIWNVIIGWTDLCTTEEKRQYLAMAKIFEDYLKNL
jgi:hypothetical protein